MKKLLMTITTGVLLMSCGSEATTATDVTTANTTVVGGFAGVGIDAFGHEYTTPTWIIGTMATAAWTGTIKWAVWYTID